MNLQLAAVRTSLLTLPSEERNEAWSRLAMQQQDRRPCAASRRRGGARRKWRWCDKRSLSACQAPAVTQAAGSRGACADLASRCAVRLRGHREVKNGAAGLVGRHPQTAAMGFYDRPADRQPHPQTAGLRRVERVEEAFKTCRGHAWPR